ncbi:hypothetical protein R9X47_18030 [Wukongibacter baidiensis]|uniref:hypothetical protein n=1 Tax=Wukongibacter baidiensis TaxID=1723361 RepID=UPI003D7FBEF6
MSKRLKIVENVFFASGIGLGLYALATTYFRNRSLPPGVCPVDNNRSLMYTAIALLLFSVVFPYVAKTVVRLKER